MGAQCCTTDSGVAVQSGEKNVGSESYFEPAEEGSTAGSFPKGYAVQVTIIGARGLDSEDWEEGQGPKDPYCTCEIPGKPHSSVSTPPSSGGTRDPTWNFQEVMPSYAFPDALVFTVFDADFHDYDSHLGKAQVSASRLQACGGKLEGRLMLAGGSGSKSAPLLHVRIEAVPRPAEVVEQNEWVARDPAELPRGRLVRLHIRKAASQALGVLVHTTEEKEAVVLVVSPDGAAAEYNRGARVEEQLQVGDSILEANGLKDREAFLKELGSSDDLELLVECRSYIFKVEMDKPAATPLGMELLFKEGGELLCISAISEGAVQSYNKTVEVEKQVRPGDHILKVNGVQDPKQRLEKLQKARGSTEFLIRRVSGLPDDALMHEEATPPKKT